MNDGKKRAIFWATVGALAAITERRSIFSGLHWLARFAYGPNVIDLEDIRLLKAIDRKIKRGRSVP